MKYKKDSLGDRMKGYENETRYYLTGKNPIIVRLDGKAFHTFTKGFQKPFDNILEMTMRKTMLYLCENIQGVSFAYTQSDEISLLLTNINMTPEYQHWFNGNIQKMASVSASMATMAFNHYFWDEVWENINPNDIDETPYWNSKPFDRNDDEYGNPKYAMFDSRVFSLPHHEVVNYFIWRQQDAIRNSKQALGQAHFSQNQLHGKNCDQICKMLKTEKEIDWHSLPVYQQRGVCARKRTYERWTPQTTKLEFKFLTGQSGNLTLIFQSLLKIEVMLHSMRDPLPKSRTCGKHFGGICNGRCEDSCGTNHL